MKYALIFVFTIFSGISNAQRIEKISKEDLIKHFKEDISSWQYFAAFNLSNSNQGIIKYTKIPHEEWSQTKISRKEVSDLILPMVEVMEFDSLGNSVGKKNIRSDLRVNFIAISDNPELKNKIGFGYQVYIKTDEQEFTVDHILFNDISNWPNLKEKRKLTFLKLFSVFPQYSKADSTINIKINDRDSKLHLFNLGANYSDSFPALNPLVDYLMKVYEKDFASVHYSGKDSSYYDRQDQFGNSKIKPDGINEYAKISEYMVELKDENGNATRQKTLPYFTHLDAISLLFEKQAASQNLRKIYPGANKPVITSSGVDLGNMNYFLSPTTLKRFSITSQILIDYLTQIYN